MVIRKGTITKTGEKREKRRLTRGGSGAQERLFALVPPTNVKTVRNEHRLIKEVDYEKP